MKSSEAVGAARYTTVAVWMHWLTAAVLVAQLVLGWRLDETAVADRAAVLQWHKSIGISILLLTLARIAWRLGHPPPPADDGLSKTERRISEWVHRGFYGLMLALPLTGWAMTSAPGGAGRTRLFGLVPWPKLPGQSLLPSAAQDVLTDLLTYAHAALVWITLGLLALHILGALRHQLLTRDGVLARMVRGLAPGRVLDVRLAAVLVGACLMIAAAYAPQAKPAPPRPKVAQLSSADIYLDVVQPALSKRCESCHTDEAGRGGLSVASYESLMIGGRSGPVVKPGDPAGSELYRRITLAHDHPRFMPKNGKRPLSAEQVGTIHWWIAHGAPRSATVASLQPDPQVQSVLRTALGLTARADADASKGPDDNADLPVVRPAAAELVTALEGHAFVVRRISQTSNLVDVDYNGAAAISPADLERLRALGPNVLRLNLRNGGLDNAALAILDDMPNLRRLRLEGNPINDGAIASIARRGELRYLNLSGSAVSGASVDALARLPKLREVYVWNSRVSPEEMARLGEAVGKAKVAQTDKVASR